MHGRIAEEGSYADLVRHNGPFSRLMIDFGGADKAEGEEKSGVEEEAIENPTNEKPSDVRTNKLTRKHVGKAAGVGRLEACI